MLINASNIQLLFNAYNGAFKEGLGMAKPHWNKIAMEVPSTTETETYGWLGDVPNVREWLGSRVVNSLDTKGYAIRNRLWESTVSLERTKIEDDQYGILAPLIKQMGFNTETQPDKLVFGLLAAGFTTPCFDGQYFFDTDHPVGGNGQTLLPRLVSNMQLGGVAGAPAWYLMDCSQPIRPMIFQKRTATEFVSLTKPDDPEVFWQDQYVWGTRQRHNVGYGLWQLAFASTAPLNDDNYTAAREAMQSQTNDAGRPLGINPGVLVVPPALERDARRLVSSALTPQTVQNTAGGTTTEVAVAVTNPWAGSAEMVMSQFLVPLAA